MQRRKKRVPQNHTTHYTRNVSPRLVWIKIIRIIDHTKVY
jgi:hypothetical protein